MARYPRPQDKLARWALQRAQDWQQATNIGLSEEQVAQLLTRAQEFALALREHAAAVAAARAALSHKNRQRARLRRLLTGLIGAIDAHASLTGDPGVYTRAMLDAPKAPATRPAPAVPTLAAMGLDTAGQVLLVVEATTGGSAVFEFERQAVGLDGRCGPWAFIAATASKRFVDADAPRGVAAASYRVRTRLTNGKTSEWTLPQSVPYGPLVRAQPGAAERPSGGSQVAPAGAKKTPEGAGKTPEGGGLVA